jgi:hypothetical protein
MSNWLLHVESYKKDHPELSYKECLIGAKPSYNRENKKEKSKAKKVVKQNKDKPVVEEKKVSEPQLIPARKRKRLVKSE